MSIENDLEEKSSEEEVIEKDDEEEEKVTLTKAEHDVLLKQKEVAENYKKENEKYRIKKDRQTDFAPAKQENESVLTEDQRVVVKNDYLSKREDVIDEFEEQLQGLEDSEWQKVKPLLTSSLDTLLLDSIQAGRYVPAGKMRKTIQGLIDYAKGEKVAKEKVEKVRKDTVEEMEKYNHAEIPTAHSTKKPAQSAKVTEEDRRASENSGGVWTPERAAEIRLRKEERSKEFAPNDGITHW